MKLFEFIEYILEGKHDYLSMMPEKFIKTNETQKLWQDEVKWAIQYLKKNDRIVWFLRLSKIAYLQNLFQALNGHSKAWKGLPESGLIQDVKTEIDRTARKSGFQSSASMQISSVMINNIKREFNHFLSLNIRQIDNYVFDKQNPGDVWREFYAIEKEWKEKQDSVIRHEQVTHDTEVLIKFPDNWQWVNLHQNFCSIEGKAMGHCGNSGAWTNNDTVLSLREPTKDGWKPHLTFILDKTTGMLGEMKGRGNNKPANKYHPYIIKLLMQDYIKGITGGGYLSGNNFSLSDLPKEQQEELINEKPELADWWTLYQMQGWNNLVKERLYHIIDLKDMTISNGMHPEIQVEKYDDFLNFIDAYRRYLKNANRYYKYVTNADTIDHWDIQAKEIETFANNLPEDVKDNIKVYVKENYPDSDEEDWFETLTSEDDIVSDLFKGGVMTALDNGAAAELRQAYKDFIKNILSYNKYIRIEFADPNDALNSEVYLKMDLKDFLEGVHYLQDDKGYEEINPREVLEHYEITRDLNDLKVPDYGFSGYDEEAGWEYFYENAPTKLRQAMLPLKFWKN